jgi:hypothetical protein
MENFFELVFASKYLKGNVDWKREIIIINT